MNHLLQNLQGQLVQEEYNLNSKYQLLKYEEHLKSFLLELELEFLKYLLKEKTINNYQEASTMENQPF